MGLYLWNARVMRLGGALLAGVFASAICAAQDIKVHVTYLCNGERIYAEILALNRPMRLKLTLVHADVPGDRYFPEWRHLEWCEVSRRESSDANYRYTFFTLERQGLMSD